MLELSGTAGWREPRGARATGVGFSLIAHGAAIGLLVLAAERSLAPAPKEEEPVRLVLIEPPPPPLLGSSGGVPGGVMDAMGPPRPAPAPAMALATPLARLLVTPRKAPAAAAPRKPAVEPPAVGVQAAKAGVAAAGATGSGADAVTGSGAVETGPTAGVPDGDRAGAAGGRAGGRVGGLGSELVPANRAAVLPAVVRRVIPVYPEMARARGIEGQVVIEATIDSDGRVEDTIRVIRSIPELDAAAIEAFRQWRFSPARDASGRPLRVLLQAPVRFVLR